MDEKLGEKVMPVETGFDSSKRDGTEEGGKEDVEVWLAAVLTGIGHGTHTQLGKSGCR